MKSRNTIPWLENSLDIGWIDDDGWFWGCRDGGHGHVLHSELGVDWADSHEHNWIIIGKKDQEYWRPMIGKKPINEKQKETLIEIGLNPDDQSDRNDSITFPDLFPNGYEHHPEPEEVQKRVRTLPDDQYKPLRIPLPDDSPTP